MTVLKKGLRGPGIFCKQEREPCRFMYSVCAFLCKQADSCYILCISNTQTPTSDVFVRLCDAVFGSLSWFIWFLCN